MSDISETLSRTLYGKSDKANALENQNEDFRAGYAVGCAVEDRIEAITLEWIRRGRPQEIDKNFKDWKRGMWAAVMQRK